MFCTHASTLSHCTFFPLRMELQHRIKGNGALQWYEEGWGYFLTVTSPAFHMCGH